MLGLDPRGVCEAWGQAAASLAACPLHPPGVVDSNPTTQIKQKPRTLTGARLFLEGWAMGVESFLAL